MSENTTKRERLARRLNHAGKRAIGVLGIAAVGFLPSGEPAEVPLSPKPSGPYVGPGPRMLGEQGPHVHKELYVDKQAQAIVLADDLGGLLMTEGFTLGYKKAAIASELQGNEVAILSQSATREDGEKITDRTIAWGASFDHGLLSNNTEARRELIRPALAQDLAENIGEYALSPKWEKRGYDVFGFGVDNSLPDTTEIDVSTYLFHADGSFTRTTQKRTTATVINNVSCESDSSQNVTSEVILTPSQRRLACTAIGKYDKFLSDDARILLDSIGHTEFRQNAYDIVSENIILTFPYQVKREIFDEAFMQLTLHESLHDAYYQLDPKSLLVPEISQAYQGIVREMKYRLPTNGEQMGSKVSVGDVEPVWRVITESTYRNEKINGRGTGHPWDAATEMVSSTATVLAFYPNEFLEQFALLSKGEQKAIRKAVEVTAKAIETFDYDVTDIIPEYPMILDRIE